MAKKLNVRVSKAAIITTEKVLSFVAPSGEQELT